MNSVSAVLCTRKSVHIPRSKIGVLAHQAQSAGIFASGEYLGDASKQKSTAPAVLFCLERCVPQSERDVHFVRDVSYRREELLQ